MMRAIVEIRGGPLQGRKALLEPGTTLRVGRTERADLVVPGDGHLSNVHFELAWDGEGCRLTDLRSAEGTALNGARVDEAGVAHGAWIRAGETVFSVYFEEATPPRRGPEDDAGTKARKERALAALEADPDPLFAVLDAARTDRILELL